MVEPRDESPLVQEMPEQFAEFANMKAKEWVGDMDAVFAHLEALGGGSSERISVCSHILAELLWDHAQRMSMRAMELGHALSPTIALRLVMVDIMTRATVAMGRDTGYEGSA